MSCREPSRVDLLKTKKKNPWKYSAQGFRTSPARPSDKRRYWWIDWSMRKKKNWPNVTLYTTSLTWNGLGSNPVPWWILKLTHMVCKRSVGTSQITQYASVRRTELWWLCREGMDACCGTQVHSLEMSEPGVMQPRSFKGLMAWNGKKRLRLKHLSIKTGNCRLP